MGKFTGKFRDTPWMGEKAIRMLESIITQDTDILETGAGSSTIWFAEKARKVISFEHKYDWAEAVADELASRNLFNVELTIDPGYPGEGLEKVEGMFDLIIIDGRGRVKGIMTTYKKLKSGGYMVLDNANRARYAPAVEFLASIGWPRKDIASKVLPENKNGFTSFWRKP